MAVTLLVIACPPRETQLSENASAPTGVEAVEMIFEP
jgi:hypothetical protein